MTVFIEKYVKARDEKNSVLCVGLDPGLKEFREKNTVADEYFAGKEVGEGLLDYCLDIIEKTSDYACAIKPNSQYLIFALNLKQLQKLNKVAHDAGLVSILDHKLGDIGSTNQSAFYWIKEAGFDGLTFSPFAGNIKEATEAAHARDLGLLVLTYMSNPDSEWLQKKTSYEDEPLYVQIAKEIKAHDSDGPIMGATGHVKLEDIKRVRETVGDDKVFLFPGIGAQSGDAGKLLDAGGENIIINVSRGVIFNEDPAAKAKEYQELFNSLRK